LRNNSTGGDLVASYNAGPYGNVAVSAQVQNTGSSGTTTLGVRWNANGGVPTEGYNVDLLGNGEVSLFRVSDWAVLGAYTIPGYTAGTWYTLTLRANSSTLSVDVDGVTRISATDSTFTSGEVGVWSYNPTSAGETRFDNFVIEPLGGGPTSTPTPTPTNIPTSVATNTPTPTATATPTPTSSGCPLSDDFNRADSTNLGANWTERADDLSIVANTLRNASTGGDALASYCGVYSNVAVSAQVQHASAGSGTTTLGVRWNANGGVPTQGYNVDVQSSGAVYLVRVSDWTVLGSYTIPGYTAGTWYTLTLRAQGANLSVDVNGVTRISATDTTFTSGEVGVWSWNASSAGQHRFDDFVIEPLGGGSTGGLILARADTSPRVVGDAARPSARVRPLLAGPMGNEVWKVYYYAGAQMIAMRVLTGTTGNTLYYLHSDHLGSTSLTTDINGAVVARQWYHPYGSVRASSGALPTDITFTGHRSESGLGSLMYFRARYFSPYLNRWLQPDSIVPEPGNPQSLNRYTFVYNNPVKYTDPTGHCVGEGTPCLVENGSSPETDDLLRFFLGLLDYRDQGKINDLQLMQMFLGAAFNIFSDPLAALQAATMIVRPGGVQVPGDWGFEFEESEYFYGNITSQRLGDTGFGDLRDRDANQVSHFIGEAYISLWAIESSTSVAGSAVLDGTIFVFGQEAQHPYQSPRQSNIDFDLGMIANRFAGALHRGADPSDATKKAVSLVVNYNYETAHPVGSYGVFEFLHDFYYSDEWPFGTLLDPPRPRR
jgi:RHS repeat-associated protein